jgi:hypothetical protein
MQMQHNMPSQPQPQMQMQTHGAAAHSDSATAGPSAAAASAPKRKSHARPRSSAEDGKRTKWAWTAEEDATMLRLVATQGGANGGGSAAKVNWSLVADSIDGRVAKQCRERWHVRARHFSSTLYAKNAHFTKTGSGQT